MNSGCTVVQQFDEFFVSNYSYLMGFSKSIDRKNDYQNLLHNCYVKCKQRIILSGYSGSTFLNFVRVTIMNQYKTDYRHKNDNLDFNDENYVDEIEAVLQLQNKQNEDEADRNYRNAYLTTAIYEYVDKFYDEKENMVFRTYYLLQGNMNYARLSTLTGYSISTVSNIISTIKKDLKLNLINYINTGKRQ